MLILRYMYMLTHITMYTASVYAMVLWDFGWTHLFGRMILSLIVYHIKQLYILLIVATIVRPDTAGPMCRCVETNLLVYCHRLVMDSFSTPMVYVYRI